MKKLSILFIFLINFTFSQTGEDFGRNVQQTFDNGYVMAGYSSSNRNSNKDVLVIKTDSEGNAISYGD